MGAPIPNGTSLGIWSIRGNTSIDMFHVKHHFCLTGLVAEVFVSGSWFRCFT